MIAHAHMIVDTKASSLVNLRKRFLAIEIKQSNTYWRPADEPTNLIRFAVRTILVLHAALCFESFLKILFPRFLVLRLFTFWVLTSRSQGAYCVAQTSIHY